MLLLSSLCPVASHLTKMIVTAVAFKSLLGVLLLCPLLPHPPPLLHLAPRVLQQPLQLASSQLRARSKHTLQSLSLLCMILLPSVLSAKALFRKFPDQTIKRATPWHSLFLFPPTGIRITSWLTLPTPFKNQAVKPSRLNKYLTKKGQGKLVKKCYTFLIYPVPSLFYHL